MGKLVNLMGFFFLVTIKFTWCLFIRIVSPRVLMKPTFCEIQIFAIR